MFGFKMDLCRINWCLSNWSWRFNSVHFLMFGFKIENISRIKWCFWWSWSCSWSPSYSWWKKFKKSIVNICLEHFLLLVIVFLIFECMYVVLLFCSIKFCSGTELIVRFSGSNENLIFVECLLHQNVLRWILLIFPQLFYPSTGS